MKTRRLRLNLPAAAAAVLVVAFASPPGAADILRYKARVYPDRAEPLHFVPVDDFRVNESVWDEGGVRYLMVRGPDGNFQVPFKDIEWVEFTRFLGYVDGDTARYDARVTCKDADVVRTGVVGLRVLLGWADGHSWYLRPQSLADRGARLFRIGFGDEGELEPAPEPEPAPVAPPPVVAPAPEPAPPPPPTRQPTDAELFAARTLEQLNAENPLHDVFFHFDRINLKVEDEAVLIDDAAWLKAYPTTSVRVEGYADPRGSNEHNRTLGERRAAAVKDYLVKQGISPDRITVATMGATSVFCPEATEPCWAKNRRSHFVFTAK